MCTRKLPVVGSLQDGPHSFHLLVTHLHITSHEAWARLTLKEQNSTEDTSEIRLQKDYIFHLGHTFACSFSFLGKQTTIHEIALWTYPWGQELKLASSHMSEFSSGSFSVEPSGKIITLADNHKFIRDLFCCFESRSCFVAQVGLKLMILLPLPLGCWDYRSCVPPCPALWEILRHRHKTKPYPNFWPIKSELT
jgi:hypothetical protein